jgi:hypothetical protein
MKKYISRLSLFLLILLVYLGANYAINSYFIESNPYKINKDKTVLIFGDSHLMSACDPNYIDNSKNICVGGEPYFISLQKIKYLLEHNSQIKTAVLGFAYHNTSGFNDVKLSTGSAAMPIMESCYPILSINTLDDVPSDNEKYLISIIHKMLLYPKKEHYSFIGRFKKDNGKGIGIKSAEGPLTRHFQIDGKPADLSTVNLEYLENIVIFCKKNDITLYLVNAPLHQEYVAGVEISYIKKYKELAEVYEKQSELYVLDYSTLELADSLYRNHDHVNKDGAVIVSKKINKIIQENSK